MRVFEDELFAIQVDFGSIFQLSFVVDEGVVRIDHDFELFGV